MPFTKKGATPRKKSGRFTKRKEVYVPDDDDDIIILDEEIPPPSKRNLRNSSRNESQNVRSSKSASRRAGRGDVELQMECEEEDLSPAQLKAIQLAKDEHDKANSFIKAARAGNILVPSSQPNTFTVVPPNPRQSEAEQAAITTPTVEKPAPRVSPVTETSSPGLPPPRPAQFMNKQKAAKPPAVAPPPTKAQADVIVIGESPPRQTPAPPPAKLTVASPPASKPPIQKTVAGATPQQVYKFVSLPESHPMQSMGSQWVIRPLLTVSPQQQPIFTTTTAISQSVRPVSLVNYIGGSPIQQPAMVSGREPLLLNAGARCNLYYEPSVYTGQQNSPLTEICHSVETTSLLESSEFPIASNHISNRNVSIGLVPNDTDSVFKSEQTSHHKPLERIQDSNCHCRTKPVLGACKLWRGTRSNKVLTYKRERHACILTEVYSTNSVLCSYCITQRRLHSLKRLLKYCQRKVRQRLRRYYRLKNRLIEATDYSGESINIVSNHCKKVVNANEIHWHLQPFCSEPSTFCDSEGDKLQDTSDTHIPQPSSEHIMYKPTCDKFYEGPPLVKYKSSIKYGFHKKGRDSIKDCNNNHCQDDHSDRENDNLEEVLELRGIENDGDFLDDCLRIKCDYSDPGDLLRNLDDGDIVTDRYTDDETVHLQSVKNNSDTLKCDISQDKSKKCFRWTEDKASIFLPPYSDSKESLKTSSVQQVQFKSSVANSSVKPQTFERSGNQNKGKYKTDFVDFPLVTREILSGTNLFHSVDQCDLLVYPLVRFEPAPFQMQARPRLSDSAVLHNTAVKLSCSDFVNGYNKSQLLKSQQHSNKPPIIGLVEDQVNTTQDSARVNQMTINSESDESDSEFIIIPALTDSLSEKSPVLENREETVENLCDNIGNKVAKRKAHNIFPKIDKTTVTNNTTDITEALTCESLANVSDVSTALLAMMTMLESDLEDSEYKALSTREKAGIVTLMSSVPLSHLKTQLELPADEQLTLTHLVNNLSFLMRACLPHSNPNIPPQNDEENISKEHENRPNIASSQETSTDERETEDLYEDSHRESIDIMHEVMNLHKALNCLQQASCKYSSSDLDRDNTNWQSITTDIGNNNTSRQLNTTDLGNNATSGQLTTTDLGNSSSGWRVNTTDLDLRNAVDKNNSSFYGQINSTNLSNSSTGGQIKTTDLGNSSTDQHINTTDLGNKSTVWKMNITYSSSSDLQKEMVTSNETQRNLQAVGTKSKDDWSSKVSKHWMTDDLVLDPDTSSSLMCTQTLSQREVTTSNKEEVQRHDGLLEKSQYGFDSVSLDVKVNTEMSNLPVNQMNEECAGEPETRNNLASSDERTWTADDNDSDLEEKQLVIDLNTDLLEDADTVNTTDTISKETQLSFDEYLCQRNRNESVLLNTVITEHDYCIRGNYKQIEEGNNSSDKRSSPGLGKQERSCDIDSNSRIKEPCVEAQSSITFNSYNTEGSSVSPTVYNSSTIHAELKNFTAEEKDTMIRVCHAHGKAFAARTFHISIECLEHILNSKIKSASLTKSKVYRRYLGRLCCEIGIDTVHQQCGVAKNVLVQLKSNYEKEMGKKSEEKPKPASKNRRFKVNYSKSLKIKLVQLALANDIDSVRKTYNINRQTLQKWIKEFKDETLSSFEFTEQELQKLILDSELRKSFHKEKKDLEKSNEILPNEGSSDLISVNSLQFSAENINESTYINSIVSTPDVACVTDVTETSRLSDQISNGDGLILTDTFTETSNFSTSHKLKDSGKVTEENCSEISVNSRSSSPYPRVPPIEIKQEPIDEELERIHYNFLHSNQTARIHPGDNNSGSVDRRHSNVGFIPIPINNLGLGETHTSAHGSNNTGTGTSQQQVCPDQTTSVHMQQTQQSSDNTPLFANFFPAGSLTPVVNSGGYRVVHTPSPVVDKKQDASKTPTPDKTKDDTQVTSAVSPSSSESTENDSSRPSSSSSRETPTPPLSTFQVSDQDLEQEKALRSTLLALKNKRPSVGTRQNSNTDDKPIKRDSVEKLNPATSGRIESLIKNVSSRVSSVYDDDQIQKATPDFNSDHSYTSPEKTEQPQAQGRTSPRVLVLQGSPVKSAISPKRAVKGFSTPIIMKSRKFADGTTKKYLHFTINPPQKKDTSVDIELARSSVATDHEHTPTKAKSPTATNLDHTPTTAKSLTSPTVSLDHTPTKEVVNDGVNLSDKLKSILQADIFNIVELEDRQKSNSAEEEDWIELLAGSAKKTDTTNKLDSSSDVDTPSKKATDVKSMSPGDEEQLNSRKRIFYSQNLKQKLGKLAVRDGVSTISKKYNIATKRISAWKSVYQDMKLSSLEFSEEEKEELRKIQSMKESSSTSSEYQIYIDNPEPDLDVTIVSEENIRPISPAAHPTVKSGGKDKVTEISKVSERKEAKLTIDLTGAVSEDFEAAASKSSDTKTDRLGQGNHPQGQSIHKSPQSTVHNKGTDVPLYISASESAVDAVRERFKQKLKGKEKESLQSQFSSSGVFTERNDSETWQSTNTQSKKSDYFDQPISKQTTSWKDYGTSTCYLCPIDGVFKYRMPTQNSKETQAEKLKTDLAKTKIAEMSKEFKWKVVKEARSSGFENSAKWFRLPVEEIKSWDDDFLKEEFNQMKASVCSHALKHGVISAAEKFSITNAKVVECLNMEIMPNNESVKNDNAPSLETPDTPSIDDIEIVNDSPSETVDIVRRNSIDSRRTSPKDPTQPTRIQKRGIAFDMINAKEGRILKPRFNITEHSPTTQAMPQGHQKSRMGPNSTSFSPSSSSKPYQNELQADMGIMPRLKQTGSEVEIASTWKQVQSYLNPVKAAEKKYSQEYKNKIIRECEQKGQKVVSMEHRVPYNEISRWRLEAKKITDVKNKPVPPSMAPHSVFHTKPALQAHVPSTNIPSFDKPKLDRTNQDINRPKENESLKIKIKLAKTPEIIESSHHNRPVEKSVKKHIHYKEMTSKKAAESAEIVEKSTPHKETSKKSSPVAVGDNENDFRIEVVNYCIQHGVFKTQKHFKVTRQSIIDLMTEYDELNRYAYTAATQRENTLSLKTKLVSREKTSVEDGTQEPVFVTNLQDYIVTTEYKQNVAEYAAVHGITAATRKFKRKSSTVKSWMSQFNKKLPDIIQSPKHSKGSLSLFQLKVVEYAKEFGITEAAKKYRKLSTKVKSWMGHHARTLRTQKKLDNEQTGIQESQLKLVLPEENQATSQKPQAITSPVWDQDFIIKPNTKSPLKLTLSPRRKSPVISIISDDVNDIETEDECEAGNTDDFEEVATWDLDIEKENKTDGKEDKNNKSETEKDNLKKLKDTDLEIEKVEKDSISEEKCDQSLNNEERKNSTVDSCVSESVKGIVDRIVEQDDLDSNKKTDETSDIKLRTDKESCSDRKGKFKDIFKVGESNTIATIEPFNEVTEEDDNDNVVCIDDEMEPSIENDDDMSYMVEVEEEEEIEKIPFEKTIMFQLQNNDIDTFFNDMNPFQIITRGSTEPKFEKQVNKEKKPSPKKPRRYADFEIMKNIEETCIFSPDRPRRNHESSEVYKSLDSEKKKKEDQDIVKEQTDKDKESKVEQNSVTVYSDSTDRKVIEANIKECSVNLHRTTFETNSISTEDIKNKEEGIKTVSVLESSKENKEANEDKTKQSAGQINQEKKEEKVDTQANLGRSLFDFLSLSNMSEKPELDLSSGEQKDVASSVLITSERKINIDKPDISVIEEKKETQASPVKLAEAKPSQEAPRSLFDNLMKNLKFPRMTTTKPPVIPVEKEESPVSQPDITVEEEKEDKDLKSKDKSERNLFDFLSPEPNVKPVVKKPFDTEETIKVVSPVKPVPVSLFKQPGAGLGRKPMFKFPKLQLPVNFGSIAKLGMAKMKDDKINAAQKHDQDEKDVSSSTKDQQENIQNKPQETIADSCLEDSRTESSSEHVSSSTAIDHEEESPIEIQTLDLKTNSNDNGETELQSVKQGVVMETFEELRKRLSEERAKKRDIEKNDMEESPSVDTTTIRENLNAPQCSQELADKEPSKVTEKDSTEETIDYEMYKEFTTQKIVLILDISKKHGIEFASTSFDLPPSVIVNWIIEKDRKQRKLGAAFSLEVKLLAVKKMLNKDANTNVIAEQYGTTVSTLQSWDEQVKWLLDSKGVLDVLNKWQNIQSVTSLHDNGKSAVVENDNTGSSTDFSEIVGNKSIDDNKTVEKTSVETTQTEEKVVITNVNIENSQKVDSNMLSEDTASTVDNKVEQSRVSEIPKVLSFVLDRLPRDFTIEQKAMIVLLMDKYGLKDVHRKLGINKGTLWTWKNQNKMVKQFILEQTSGERKKTTNIGYTDTEKTNKITSSPNIKSKPPTVMVDLTEAVNQSEEDMGDASAMPTGYRYISPTKLPSSLKDTFKRPTREYSLEQRVAIVKLVELYGVRTVHKQFRIPCGSIWNWQHSESVLKEMKKSESKDETGSNASQIANCLSFDGEENRSDPFTIDLIMDRVLVAIEKTGHVKLKNAQKADIVCMIQYFGIDYVCEKFPSIPRGTMWNWCHNNKNVQELVDKNMQLLKKFDELMGKKGRFVEEEKVDKVLMTQQWLNSCQGTVIGSKRKSQIPAGEGGSSIKRTRSNNKSPGNPIDDDTTVESEYSGSCRKSRKDGETNLDGTQRDSSSDSSVSSISGHSNGFEEIVSDDEANAPSVYSRRSGASGRNSLTSKDSSSSRAGRGNHISPKPNRPGSSPGSSSMSVDERVEVPDLEVLRIEQGGFNRLMVLYREIPKGSGKDSSSSPAGTKRPSTESPTTLPPPKKKTISKKDDFGETDSSGNWLPLDEYYYGTMEGDPAYIEDKGEFRFKCWYCSKMLYNNVRAMQHIQGHIDSSKQQNIELSDLTQCKHCYKQFDTPFEMQTHVEKVHLSNKVLMCRICEKDFPSPKDLIQHMRMNHSASEMPYVCQLCNFRSSMYSDVVDHFKKKHDSSNKLLCLYCLRAFDVKFVSQGWGQTQTYYGHLMKHQAKTTTKKCVACRLTFFNAFDIKNHRKNNHGSNHSNVLGLAKDKISVLNPVLIKIPGSDVPQKKKGQKIKSLNAPSMSKIQDYGDVQMPGETRTSYCIECKMTMSSTDHYKKHINCSLCRFATSCSVAYANHMMGFHSGQMSSLNLNIPWERPQPSMLYCACGFFTKYGNKIANHLVFCCKQTCYSQKPMMSASSKDAQVSKGDKKSEGSLLGMLGLVQKKSVATNKKGGKGVRTAQTVAKAKKEEELTTKTKETTQVETKKASPDAKQKSEKSVIPITKDGPIVLLDKVKADATTVVIKSDDKSAKTIETKSEELKSESETQQEKTEGCENSVDVTDKENKQDTTDLEDTEIKESDEKPVESKEIKQSTSDDDTKSKNETGDEKEKESIPKDSEEKSDVERTEESKDDADDLDLESEIKESDITPSEEVKDDKMDVGKQDDKENAEGLDEASEEVTDKAKEIDEKKETCESDKEVGLEDTEVDEDTNKSEDKEKSPETSQTEISNMPEMEGDKSSSSEEKTGISEDILDEKIDDQEMGEDIIEAENQMENKSSEKEQDPSSEIELENDSSEADKEKETSEIEQEKEAPEADKEQETSEMDTDILDSSITTSAETSELNTEKTSPAETDSAPTESAVDKDKKSEQEEPSVSREDQSTSKPAEEESRQDNKQDSSRSDKDRHQDDRSRDRDSHHHGDRHSSYRSDGHRERSHDRDYDRDRSHDRGYDRDRSNRDGYHHGQDNRSHGYHNQRGHGGYHGNQDRHRDHNRDYNNRNYGNRGGYHGQYRGGYRGGYY